MRKLFVVGLLLLLTAGPSCRDDNPQPTGPSGSVALATGDILVSLAMSGADMDADGCTVTMDGETGRQLSPGAIAAFSHVPGGTHEIAIEDVAANCEVDGGTSRSVTVVAGQVATDTFLVRCRWRSRIAFSRVTSAGYEIFTMNPDGTEELQLTSDSEESWGPEWSPDGTKIAFERGRPYGKDDSDYMAVYVMNSNGTEQVRLTNSSSAFGLKWSPDGRMITWIESWATTGLYVSRADGSERVQICEGYCRSPTWSPDGSKIAFTHIAGDNNDIFAVNADGTGLVNLSNTPGGEHGTVWSPDGSVIAYVCEAQPFEYHICIMNADGTEQARLSDGSSPTWSPDGRTIAFVRDFDVYSMGADGTGRINLTPGPGWDRQPTWSPDGNRIAFQCRPEGGAWDICSVASDGTQRVNLTNHPDRDEDPVWSPDMY